MESSLQIRYHFSKLVIFVIAIVALTSSCNSTKFLKDDELLVRELEMTIKKNESIEDVTQLKDELSQFYRLKPNRKFLGTSREWYYYRNQDPGDTTWIKKWRKNKIGEVPAILEEEVIAKSVEDMGSYLRNKKGYYEAEVDYDIDTIFKYGRIKYIVNPGERYFVNDLEYISKDGALTYLIDEIKSEALVKSGDPIDAYLFDLEKQRIVSTLQNKGYADFNLSHISIVGDSTVVDHKIDIAIELLPTANSGNHKKFTIGEINIFTDFHQFQKAEDVAKENHFGKNYFRQSKKFLVKPKMLERKQFLVPGQLYNSDNYSKTIRKLFSLDTYKFVKLTPLISEKNDSTINYNVFLTPHANKWSFDLGTDVFYSNTQNRDISNLIGFAFGTGLENRNAFHGSETYKVNLEAGVEFNASTDTLINTITLGINNSLDIPMLSKALNTLPLFNKLGIIKDKSYRKMEDEGTTRISAGVNYLGIFNQYNLLFANANYGYEIPFNKNSRIVYNQIGFDYADYETFEGIQEQLNNNPALDSSFQNTFFSGLLLKDFTYYFQTDKPSRRSNFAVISNVELSGFEIFLANKLLDSSKTWKVNSFTNFEKFIKLNFDGRWYKGLWRDSQLAARFRTGIAIPFGDIDNITFIKKYFAGGPSGIRAWRQNELGPGGYYFNDPDVPFLFQRADFSMDFSVEYRFDIFWLLEGGLFLDGGNIWTIKEDPSRPNAHLSKNFIDQIALGYGFGLRFDFTYFLIRFDFAYKLRHSLPMGPNNSHWAPLKGQGIFHSPYVAINYPF